MNYVKSVYCLARIKHCHKIHIFNRKFAFDIDIEFIYGSSRQKAKAWCACAQLRKINFSHFFHITIYFVRKNYLNSKLGRL